MTTDQAPDIEQPTRVECGSCRSSYDPANASSVEHHTVPINCSQTTRCRRCYGAPACHFCQGCFCFCTSH
ncbi:hypothetical protein [Streptomyces sp. TLI_171]|uniref:hypothetical protein n=1 Tax=Streptomyces sp. TLI_171 TaxID=1938859 RepID=UPI000C1A0F73|nr:hypothetical protein [Streptomyces sp. TLI_171]RKE02911.1 hypothetical protein BX266_7514 [Streptomyces sp. TLI_171]